MSNAKANKAEAEGLYAELTQLEAWTNPKPDPTVWPPKGWTAHPTAPGWYCRMLTEDDLREEVFGSEQKTEWLKSAAARITEIKKRLAEIFFPKAKEEGVQRVTKHGFVTMFKPGLARAFDLPALATVVAECQKISDEKKLGINVEATVIDWKPSLKLDPYRELPKAIQKQFDAALIVTPTKPVFEIVRVGDDVPDDEEAEA